MKNFITKLMLRYFTAEELLLLVKRKVKNKNDATLLFADDIVKSFSDSFARDNYNSDGLVSLTIWHWDCHPETKKPNICVDAILERKKIQTESSFTVFK